MLGKTGGRKNLTSTFWLGSKRVMERSSREEKWVEGEGEGSGDDRAERKLRTTKEEIKGILEKFHYLD